MFVPDPQRSHVVLIGTSEYADINLDNVPAVGKNISDLAAALTDPVYGLVPENHCTMLDDEGDLRLIGRKLKLAAQQAEDLLLVYFAGHGLIGGPRHDLYLALPDSEWADPEFNSLEYDKLRSVVLDSPADAKVIVLDCCFSGRAVSGAMADPVTAAIGQVEVKGTYVLVSAHRDKVALVIPGEDHTAFTGRLLRLLHEGVPGGPEFLTIDYLYRQLLIKTQAEGLPQPQKHGTDSADSLALARNRAYASDVQLAAEPPDITVDEAMADLDNMIGLNAVKEQIRSIAASIEAARRRAVAGYATDKPMQHMVFLGPPGTGKTAVARIVAKIFYAFGLLDTPAIVEAHRADLIGEYLGATAIKTNELIDSALGGVLFIDEAHSLVNEGDGQADRFGSEAVQALLTRAEDDRDNLIIILAGYERQMENFLGSNLGLTSMFKVIKFSGYTPAELLALAVLDIERRGQMLDSDARPVLWRLFEQVGRWRLADELGNGRFVRSVLEKAGQARDVRVMAGVKEPTSADLRILRADDLEQAFLAELTTRFRGYGQTPPLESALAELDALIGLEPVKRQVNEIAAQLKVARLRDAHGLASQPPARHFVFTGPPGTGKTTVARILGRIFAALGLLVRPNVVEARRADLVGEHLGSTAIKTNRLIDSALGGVLVIDGAHELHKTGYADGDAVGAVAVQTLLKRAEDDRGRLVIVLVGNLKSMDEFMRIYPALASRFRKIEFPSYSAEDLSRIAMVMARRAGDSFDTVAEQVLDEIFKRAVEAGSIDELGNGRIAQSLYEHACAYRDLRVVRLEDATAEDLTTVTADDVTAAYQDLTS
jgi:SpoVK/Ycf46/Vps4 family AAA+-type ATPase